jgi:two-component system nitrate/nitrite response regulator NarL
MLPITLLIADDHSLFRRGLVSLFRARTDFLVVGEAADGAEAVSKARQLKPDVILLDVRMPGLNGVEALRLIRSEQPASRVVMLTATDDDKIVTQALKDGAWGYILKSIEPGDLFHQLHLVMRGESVLDDAIAERLGKGMPTWKHAPNY